MKEKIITIKPKGISQKQWASFLLELNLMKCNQAYVNLSWGLQALAHCSALAALFRVGCIVPHWLHCEKLGKLCNGKLKGKVL